VAYKNVTGDTFYYYNGDYAAKSARFIVTTNGTIKDTINKEVRNIKDDKKEENRMSIKGSGNKFAGEPLQDIYKEMRIVFNRPISFYNQSVIAVWEDTSLNIIAADLSIDPKDKTQLVVNYKWQPNHLYTVHLPANSLVDQFAWGNDEISYKARAQKADNYGSLIIKNNSNAPERHLLLTVKDQWETVLYQKYLDEVKEKKIVIPNLLSGSYKVQVLEDRNKNGKWDAGNYIEHKQPEKYYTFGEKVNLKPGWEAEVEIKLESTAASTIPNTTKP
jgi:hypothetical protein